MREFFKKQLEKFSDIMVVFYKEMAYLVDSVLLALISWLADVSLPVVYWVATKLYYMGFTAEAVWLQDQYMLFFMNMLLMKHPIWEYRGLIVFILTGISILLLFKLLTLIEKLLTLIEKRKRKSKNGKINN